VGVEYLQVPDCVVDAQNGTLVASGRNRISERRGAALPGKKEHAAATLRNAEVVRS
jgi:hypothetical protein